MGYTTDFSGHFKFNKKLDTDTMTLLTGLATTRRMKRKGLGKAYGVEGEFYINGGGEMGQAEEKSIVDYNKPPKTQPSLWLQWIPGDDGKTLQWDGGEKFYHYIEWLQYLIDKIIKPRKYVLSGSVKWQGEDMDDRGIITVKSNKITVKHLE